jgi:hypothetical protein
LYNAESASKINQATEVGSLYNTNLASEILVPSSSPSSFLVLPWSFLGLPPEVATSEAACPFLGLPDVATVEVAGGLPEVVLVEVPGGLLS